MGYLAYDVNLKTFLWVIIIVYFSFLSIYSIIKAKEIPKPEKNIYFTLAFVNICFIANRIFFILSDYERDANGETLLHFRFVATGYIFLILAALNMVNGIEINLQKETNHWMLIIVFSLLVFNVIMMIVFPELMPIIRYINYGLLFSIMGILAIVYSYFIAITPRGEGMKRAILTLLSIIIILISAILDNEYLISIGLLPYYSPFVLAAGITILAYSYIFKKENN